MKNIRFFAPLVLSFFVLSNLCAQSMNTLSYGASVVIDGGCVNRIAFERVLKKSNSWGLKTEIAGCFGAFPLPLIYNTKEATIQLNKLSPQAVKLFTFGAYVSRNLFCQSKQCLSFSAGVLGRGGIIVYKALVGADPIFKTVNGQPIVVGFAERWDFPYSNELNIVIPTKLTYERKGKLTYVVSSYYNYIPTPIGASVHLLGLSMGVGF